MVLASITDWPAVVAVVSRKALTGRAGGDFVVCRKMWLSGSYS